MCAVGIVQLLGERQDSTERVWTAAVDVGKVADLQIQMMRASCAM